MQSEILDRLPPHSIDAEQQVLGSIMLMPSIIDDVASLLSPEDFYVDAHRTAYTHLVAMSEDGRRIDPSLFLDRLRTSGDLERVGGTAGLVEIYASVSSPRHFRDQCQIVRRDAEKRSIIEAGLHAAAEAYNGATTPEGILGDLEARLSAIKPGQYDTDPVSMSQACVGAIGEIDEIVRRGKGAGIMTGLPAFDEQLGGLFPGELTIIAARPRHGKTSLALQMAAHAASTGRVTYFATLEMGCNELATKRLCAVAGVSSMRIRTGSITNYEQANIMKAAQSVAVDNFHLHDWPEIRPFDIQRAARRVKADIVFVDYLQIVTPPDSNKKRYEQVGDIARRLKVMSGELGVPVVACCQLNRQTEQGKETRPMLAHLRESGNLEQEADVVLMVFKPEGGVKTWDADLIVAKNRKGTLHNLRLDWDGKSTTFTCDNYVPPPVGGGAEWTPNSAF